MESVVFFSGTHGCGKTKTIERVSDMTSVKIYQSSDGDHGNPYKEPFPRQVWRLTKYYLDSLEISEETKSEGKLLVDRCVFDHEAYTNAFYSLGWINNEQVKIIRAARENYFGSQNLPQNVVWFNPPEEWTIERIKTRWDEEKKKWNEGDFEYLKVLRQEFGKIYERERERNVLIVAETDLEKRVEIITEFFRG